MRHSQDIVLNTYNAICSAWLTNEALVDSVAPHTVVGTAGVVPSISCLHGYDGHHWPLHCSTATIHSLSVFLNGIGHCKRVSRS